MLSAETDRCEELSSSDQIANILKGQHKHEKLQPGKIYEIDKKLPIDGCQNKAEDVTQHLLAVVRTGQDYYSIVKAGQGPDGTENPALIVTQSQDNRRAEICAIIEDDQPIIVGGERFVVLDTENTVYIANTSTIGNTHVFTARKKYETIDNSVGGIQFWSSKSSIVRTILDTQDL